MKKYFITVALAIVLALFVAIPAQASTSNDLAGISQQQTPAFIQDLEFNFKTEAEMAEVRGEIWPQIVVSGTLAIITYLHYKWVTDPEWILNNQTANTLWNELRSWFVSTEWMEELFLPSIFILRPPQELPGVFAPGMNCGIIYTNGSKNKKQCMAMAP